mgnify:CR=1 FL=1
MKKLEMGELVYLEENREYVVISTVKKDSQDYAFLLTTEKPYKVKFALIKYEGENLNLEILHDKSLKQELMRLFQEKLSF